MSGGSVDPVRLLAELEDLIRTMPDQATIRHETNENISWIGRAAAIVDQWRPDKDAQFQQAFAKFSQVMARESSQGFGQIMVLIHQARNDLRMRTIGPVNAAIGQGGVFDYFDNVRKIIETASQEVFFVDPYLDVEFVSRYLCNVRNGTTIRLLTSDKKLATLLPAVDLFTKQYSHVVQVRSTNGIHDRYVFVDQISCYQSGASFKDGARQAPTTLTQITDTFSVVMGHYEKCWISANIER